MDFFNFIFFYSNFNFFSNSSVMYIFSSLFKLERTKPD